MAESALTSETSSVNSSIDAMVGIECIEVSQRKSFLPMLSIQSREGFGRAQVIWRINLLRSNSSLRQAF